MKIRLEKNWGLCGICVELSRGFKGILRCFSLLQLFCKINDGESPVGLGSTLYILLSTTDPPSHSPENYVTPQKSTNSFPPPDTYDWPEWSRARRTHVAARSVSYIWVLRLPKQHHQPFPFIVHWVSNWGESSRAFWSVFFSYLKAQVGSYGNEMWRQT